MLNFLKKRWFVIIILLVFVGVIIYTSTKKNEKNNADKVEVKREDLKEELSLSGKIEAEEKATLRFQTSGRLTWVGVKEGDEVKKYQTIAILDQRDLKNRLDKYLNTYAKTRNSFEQTKDDNWNDQYDFSESVRDSAERVLKNNQYDLENAVLDVEYQKLAVELSSLWTPIEGIVTYVSSPHAGVNITPTGAEFEIVNPETLYFSATAEQADIVNLFEGKKGKIVLDAFPSDKEIEGVIYYISFTPKEGETGTVYEVKLKMEKDPILEKLRLEMTGDLNFELKEKKNILAVPSRFVKKSNGKEYVITEKNNRTEKVFIKTGVEIDGKTEILSGIDEGDFIIDE